MSVIVFTESWEGRFKKSTFEAVSYGAEVAKLLGTTVTAVSIGNVSDDDLKALGKYGATKVLSVKNDKLNSLVPQAFASIIAEAARSVLEGASIYLSVFPCPDCAKLIAHSGIKKVYFSGGHASFDGEVNLRAEKVEIIFVEN